ncbi:hypothetical protein CI109_105334 [Kwoniella shandongensis]|uniref:Uncharacterized protein n=1 Tax=Kwoniella shandongensis TaxID=1734106 RepID=A0A5M6BNP8_9TREE|nr:uncharacterized protein CI109_007340 [Kwoniella shandongensis]KAA5524327.1 hypothetical protein CI109_007340 [Kwoniella shandongensis]
MVTSVPTKNTQVVLNERPKAGPITDTTFRSQTVDIPELKDGEVLVKVTYTSLDPTQRGWINDTRSYLPPVEIGAPMRSNGLGRVVVSKSDDFKAGDLVQGLINWQEYYVGPAQSLTKKQVPEGGKEIDFLGLFGMTGLTAYIGLFDIGQIKDGDHVVISGAAGAVGLTATQIALSFPKCKVTAIAGNPEKLEYLKKLGAHNVLNYKDEDFKKQFKNVGLIDVYFDNVGGAILDQALAQIAPYARIVACGAISAYNADKPTPIYNYFNVISMKATWKGFIVMDHAARFKDGITYLADLQKQGKLEYKYHVTEGLDTVVGTLQDMFAGKNVGKTVVKVAKDDSDKSKL